MPASRSALAMIFAPRSWPSRPALAITTRIRCPIRAAVYGDGPSSPDVPVPVPGHTSRAGSPQSRYAAARRRRHPRCQPRLRRPRMKLIVVGCSPAWPNPGGAQSGYLVEGSGRLLLDCGPGVLARLRLREGWPLIDSIVISHWHLDHWGDLVPWVWGSMFGLGREAAKPQLWLPPEGIDLLRTFGERMGTPTMFWNAFDIEEYAEGEPFETVAGLTITA